MSAATLLLAATASPGIAFAATPIFRVAFVQPTLNTLFAPTDSIEVWMRVTLDATAPAIDYVAGDVERYSAWGAVPTTASFWDPVSSTSVTEEIARIENVRVSTWFSCGNEFTNGCDPGAYTFNWNDGADPNKPSVSKSLSLQPGASIDYLFGTFVPNGAGAPAGTYQQRAAEVTIDLDVRSVTGRYTPVEVYTSDACYSEPQCMFTRQVGAVPEPSTYGLMVIGLLLLGARVRRASQLPG